MVFKEKPSTLIDSNGWRSLRGVLRRSTRLWRMPPRRPVPG